MKEQIQHASQLLLQQQQETWVQKQTVCLHTTVSQNGTLGATTFSGVATSAQYADLAEMYADDDIEEGTVVMFAGEGKVVACDRNNCRRVAGIVLNPCALNE